jgi:predicted TIM-barrel fold metal-dependent hydrolase
MLIDAHMHVKFGGFDAKSLIQYMDTNRIDQCWVLSWVGGPPGYRSSIEDVYEAYQKYPGRVIPMYAPDPANENAVTGLLEWQRKGLRGIGEVKVCYTWDSAQVAAILTQASQLGLPIVFHMQEASFNYIPLTQSTVEKSVVRILNTTRANGLPRRLSERAAAASACIQRQLNLRWQRFPGYLPDFDGLEERLKQFPGVNFVGHGPLFWKAISAKLGSDMYPRGPVQDGGIMPNFLERYGNLYAELSGGSGYYALSRDTKFAKRFLSKFSHKVLYGTDNASLGLMGLVRSLGLSRRAYARICGENALRLIEGTR